MKKQFFTIAMCLAFSSTTALAVCPVKVEQTAPAKATVEIKAPVINTTQPPAPEAFMNPEKMGKKKFEERMMKERENFYKTLDLSCDQKTKAEAFDKKNREKLDPLMAEMRKEKTKLLELKNKNASKVKVWEQKQKLKALKRKMRATMEASKKEFETILTPEQKVKFEEMDAKRKAEMKKFKNGHKYRYHNQKNKVKKRVGCPLTPAKK